MHVGHFGPLSVGPPRADLSARLGHFFPSWRRHLPPNPSSGDVMASSKKLARLLLQGGENACLLSTPGPNRTAYMHYDKLPGKKKKKERKENLFILLFLFLRVCCCEQEPFVSLVKGSHK